MVFISGTVVNTVQELDKFFIYITSVTNKIVSRCFKVAQIDLNHQQYNSSSRTRTTLLNAPADSQEICLMEFSSHSHFV